MEGGRLTKVLVTGATGYVGSRLVQELAARDGTTVRALVREAAGWLPTDDQALADLTRPKDLEAICRGVDAVVHLAGSNEIEAAADPDRALIDTSIGTRRLVDAASASDVARFVYLSTVHVYGESLTPGAVITEETVPRPRAVYSIARLAAEHIARAESRGMDVTVLRLTNSVGAPAHPSVERWTLVANDLCRQAATLGALELRSDGLQWRDFVGLTEVCALLADAASGCLGPGTYNVGSGTPMSIRGLAEIVQACAEARTGRRPSLKAPEPAAGPDEPYVVSVDALARAGYRLSSEITPAIDETLRFCLEWRERLGT